MSEFPRSGIVHTEEDDLEEGVTGNGMDYRDNGYVTDVSNDSCAICDSIASRTKSIGKCLTLYVQLL